MVSSITNIIIFSFMSYALTFVIASSSLFAPFREKVKKEFPKLKFRDYKHFIECRMCVGFWSSVAICLSLGSYIDILSVYGLSYFLATQER